MNIKNKLFIFLLFIVLIGSVSFISAVSTDSMDNIGSDVVSNDEFISLSSDEQAGTVDESVLSAQKEINNLSGQRESGGLFRRFRPSARGAGGLHLGVDRPRNIAETAERET